MNGTPHRAQTLKARANASAATWAPIAKRDAVLRANEARARLRELIYQTHKPEVQS